MLEGQGTRADEYNTFSYVYSPNRDEEGISIIVNVGAIYEKAGTRGVSHFIEHLAGMEIERMCEGKLCLSNASTSSFVTSYEIYSSVTPSALVDIVSMLFHKFHKIYSAPQKTNYIFKERKVVAQEAKLYNPWEGIEAYCEEWFSSGVCYPIAGQWSDIHDIGNESMLKWWKKYYGANNALIVFYGDAKFLKYARTTFTPALDAIYSSMNSSNLAALRKDNDFLYTAERVISRGLYKDLGIGFAVLSCDYSILSLAMGIGYLMKCDITLSNKVLLLQMRSRYGHKDMDKFKADTKSLAKSLKEKYTTATSLLTGVHRKSKNGKELKQRIKKDIQLGFQKMYNSVFSLLLAGPEILNSELRAVSYKELQSKIRIVIYITEWARAMSLPWFVRDTFD